MHKVSVHIGALVYLQSTLGNYGKRTYRLQKIYHQKAWNCQKETGPST